MAAKGAGLTGRRSSVLRAEEGSVRGFERAREGTWTGPYFFIQAADPQLGMFEHDRRWDYETARFERAVEHINRLQPRFVIVAGDEVNQLPGGSVYADQVTEFFRIADKIEAAIPVICLSGNHDIGDHPTPQALSAYRENFGDDWYEFWAGGVCYIVLNTCLYFDPSQAPDEHERQERWLDRLLERLRTAPARHAVVLQHHPWFLEHPEDADQYFTIPRVRRAPALRALRRAGVRVVFAGHYHRNAYGRDHDMEMVTTSAVGMPLGDDPSGLRIVEVYADRIEHRYYGLDEVPEAVQMAEA